MIEDKKNTIVNLFDGREIRSVWDAQKEDYYFSVVDVIQVLANPKDPSDYWTTLKKRLSKEEKSEIPTNCRKLKIQSRKDGKSYPMDTLDTKGILRLIESIPSPKAEPFKVWLANLGSERIDEVFDPEKAIKRAISYYHKKGYSDEWIKRRIKGIFDRNKLTDIWRENGIKEEYEYGVLTNEIYKEWSGMSAQKYKEYKEIRKESLRDNMTDIEIILTDLGEITTRELAKKYRPYGLEDNRKIAKEGGSIAKHTRENIENKLGESVVCRENFLNYKYADATKKLKNNKK